MKNHAQTTTRRFGAIGIIGLALGLVLALAAPVLADVTIDATHFTIDSGTGLGNNTVVSNWVGAPFVINAPVLVAAHYLQSPGNDNVTISNFVINSSSESWIGIYPSSNVTLTLLPNTIWNQTSGNINVEQSGGGISLVTLTVNGASITNSGGYTFIGRSDGSNNRLILTNGAVFTSSSGLYTSIGNATGTNNNLTVTGTGSVYQSTVGNPGFFISDGGGGTNLLISNGGQVLYKGSTVSFGSKGGTILVTDPGSIWSNSLSGGGGGAGYGMGIAVNTSGDSLIISNGAAFLAAGGTGSNDGRIMLGWGGTSVSNNITVTGSGSLFSNNNASGTSGLFLGAIGSSFDSVNIVNSGRVVIVSGDDSLIIGGLWSGTDVGSNNVVTIAGTGSLFQSSGANPGKISVGQAGQGNQLIVSNGASLINTNTSGSTSYATLAIGLAAGGNRNSVVVTGPGSSLYNLGTVTVGVAGAYNTLTVADGANLTVGGTVAVGGGAGASNNSIVVNSAVFSNLSALSVGLAGSQYNTLTGLSATIYSTGLNVGAGNSSNNTVYLDAASTWNFRGGALTVGSSLGKGAGGATGNQFVALGTYGLTNLGGLNLYSANTSLFLSNRNLASSISGINLGAPGMGGNSVTLSNLGINSTSAASILGLGSSNNVLTVLTNAAWNGGGATLTIGSGAGTGNVLLINGGVVTNVNTLTIGNATSPAAALGNGIVITNGGYFGTTGVTDLGLGNSRGNSVLVTGAGSVWSNAGWFYLTSSSMVTVANGGRLWSGTSQTLLGYSGNSNMVLVTDPGSTMVCSNGFTLGGYAALQDFNMLAIRNGAGVVSAGDQTIGPGTSNTLLVADPGSVLTNTGVGNVSYGFQVGWGSGTGNSLIVSNGGTVINKANAGIGWSGTGTNNFATVTGSGSVWSNTGYIVVGYLANYDSMTVANSGKVFSANGYIGGQANSNVGGSTNSVTITDTGSVWAVAGVVTIGAGTGGGVGNQLIVSNGAKLVSGNLTVGSYLPNAINNRFIVDGGLSSNGWIVVGSNSVGNQVLLNNRGTVVASGVVAGGAAGANNNSVLVSVGSVLEANTLSNYFGGSGNTISNVSGVYQFTVSSPTIAPNGAGNIAVNNGTISFTRINTADVTNNLGNGALKGITFAGANTFMLNSASNNTSGQAYTFQAVGANPSNYAALAMVNGETAYRGGGVTIGAAGSLLVKDTKASFTDVLTNQGVAVLMNSTEAFSGGLFNQGTVTNYNNNSFTGLLTMNNGTFVTAGGTAQNLPSNLNIQGTGTFDTSGGNLIVPTDGITNGNVFAKIGTGNLVMTGPTAFAGEMQAIAGAVVLGNSFALSNSTVNVVSGAGSLVFSNNGAYTLGGLKGGAGSAVALTGSDNNPVALTVGNNGQNTTFGGSLSGGGSITKVGAGTLVFSGPNSYSGDTYINQGQLVLADPSAAAKSSVAVNLNNGLAFSNATSFAIAGLTGSGNIGLVNVGGAGIGLTVSNTDNSLTYSGVMSGSGSLTKAGNGTFELTGNNTFNGTVGVSAGKLLVNGSLTGGGPLTLSADATLAGSGTVGRVVSGAGQVAPGNSPGLLTVNQLDPSAGMGFEFEFTQLTPNFGNLGAIGNDVLRITNATPFTVALGLSNTVNLVVTAPLTAGVINYLRGGFYSDSGAMFDPTINGATYNLFIDDGGPLAFVHTVAETTPWGTGRILEIGVWGKMIPEPQVVMFWLTGAATLYAARRRMRRQK